MLVPLTKQLIVTLVMVKRPLGCEPIGGATSNCVDWRLLVLQVIAGKMLEHACQWWTVVYGWLKAMIDYCNSFWSFDQD